MIAFNFARGVGVGVTATTSRKAEPVAIEWLVRVADECGKVARCALRLLGWVLLGERAHGDARRAAVRQFRNAVLALRGLLDEEVER